jgi:hypothetical protein
MWVVVAREPEPDAAYWPGRRWLAVFDAAVWPPLWVVVFSYAPKPVGLVGPFITAVAVLCGLNRLHRALWLNHRYRFTTWRWGKVVAAMLLMAWVMKLTLPG